MRREQAAYAALFLALTWFALGAPRASRALLDAHAQTVEHVQLEHITAAINLAAQREPELLPKGKTARELADWLQEALDLEPTRHDWPLRAFSVLSPKQVTAAKKNPVSSFTRSRKWPATPGVILDVVEATSLRYGSATDIDAPPAAKPPWRGASPIDLGESILGLLLHGPDLSQHQARALLTAALAGMHAHEAQSHLVEALARGLGSHLVGAVPMELVRNMPPDRQSALGKEAVSILSRRADQIP